MKTTQRVIPIVERPICAVRGVLKAWRTVCGEAGVGGRDCHYEGKCGHQQAAPQKGE